LVFSLAGIETVISVVLGASQMALIEAALRAGVERFIPAEFEGPPSLRQPTSPLDRGRSAALALLRHYESQGMAHTIFVCGILYERFAPGGMRAANIGGSCGASGEGGYLLDVRSMRSQIPYDSSGHPAMICMTSAQDVGKSIVAALNLPQLPRELRMYGTRMDVSAIVHVAELFRRSTFERAEHSSDTLQSALTLARTSQDRDKEISVRMLIATGEGQFDFDKTNLNGMVNITPVHFGQWLQSTWAGQLP